MAIGPVQLIVLGFTHPDFHGEVIAELERLRESDTVRVIDALAVYKDASGEIEVEHLSNLTQEQAMELGSKVGALLGLGIDGDVGAELGAEAGADAAANGPDFDVPAPDSSGAGVIEGPVIEGLGAGKSTGLQQRAVGAPPAVLVAGVGVFALGLIAAIAGARREPDLQRGEVVLFQG